MAPFLAMLFAWQFIVSANAQEVESKTFKLNGTDFSYTVLKTPQGRDFGYFAPASRWPSSADGITRIHVCWENYRPDFSRQHQLVQEAVTATWERNSKLQFKGWNSCANRSSGIRIFVHDLAEDGPHTKGLGHDLDEKSQGMVLNFTMLKWIPYGGNQGDLSITSIAVHEFGHAIGFAHEQNRPDTPGECSMLRQGPSSGAVALTPYDKDSVMNYCSTNANNNGQLSTLDIIALRKVYGAN